MLRTCHRSSLICSLLIWLAAPVSAASPQDAELSGYLQVPLSPAPPEFGGGFSMHVAAWPMLAEHPGPRFQTGLFSTWMFAQPMEPKLEGRHYSDIEGGLGWWRDTRWPTETPKFIMGGVALEFSAWANGPGAGKGRDWDKPQGKYAVAQLSPWVLWPPDGLNLAQGTNGELFGYGYLPLPLTEAKSTTAGVDVPTGNRCWTLFVDAENFKGPIAFFLPYFFSRASVEHPEMAGRFLDSRPSNPGRQISMETQYIPAQYATADDGERYARIGRTRFPVDAVGESVLVHRMRSFTEAALWDRALAWFEGGPAVTDPIDAAQSHVHAIRDGGNWGWSFRGTGTGSDEPERMGREIFGESVALGGDTYGFRWSAEALLERTENGLVRVPEYYRRDASGEKPRWIPVAAQDVPVREQLDGERFVEPYSAPPGPYVTPTDGCWAEPGPVAGPFEAELGDGSVVTYSWYRFADQPALQNADLTLEERERMQARVELLHRTWTKDKQYLPPATVGTLALIDPALIVQPPAGFEIGYVPIATRQAAR